jgi:hypothetical protein
MLPIIIIEGVAKFVKTQAEVSPKSLSRSKKLAMKKGGCYGYDSLQ